MHSSLVPSSVLNTSSYYEKYFHFDILLNALKDTLKRRRNYIK